MKFDEYLKLCEGIVNEENRTAPYDQADYLEYTIMNVARMQRWLKKGKISEAAEEAIKRIDKPQEWILITEPWCGDAAHTVPFIYLLAQLNSNITLNIELRDSEPHRIEQYLTDGGKSIPKWLVRGPDRPEGEDIWVWGPRPVEAQRLFISMKNQNAEMDAIMEAIQKWYNEDQGRAFLEEVAAEFNS